MEGKRFMEANTMHEYMFSQYTLENILFALIHLILKFIPSLYVFFYQGDKKRIKAFHSLVENF